MNINDFINAHPHLRDEAEQYGGGVLKNTPTHHDDGDTQQEQHPATD